LSQPGKPQAERAVLHHQTATKSEEIASKRNNPRTSSNERDIEKSRAHIIERTGYRDEKRGERERHYQNALVVEGWCRSPNAGALFMLPLGRFGFE